MKIRIFYIPGIPKKLTIDIIMHGTIQIRLLGRYRALQSRKMVPQTPENEVEREQHYMGNMTLNPRNPNIVYLSREVKGIFEIEKYATNDHEKHGTLHLLLKILSMTMYALIFRVTYRRRKNCGSMDGKQKIHPLHRFRYKN